MRTTCLSMTALALLTGAAMAQSSGVAGPGPTTGTPSDEVVKPGATVDPGMKVIKPKMPRGSTPVIKPKTTAPGGAVVVPR